MLRRYGPQKQYSAHFKVLSLVVLKEVVGLIASFEALKEDINEFMFHAMRTLVKIISSMVGRPTHH
jgi:hypothetical protein